MPIMRKPIGSADVFGDNFLTRLFPGNVPDPTEVMGGGMMAAAGDEISGPLAKMIEKLKSMLGESAPVNVGDSILRNHSLDSRVSGLEPPARTGLPGKGAGELQDDAYNRIMEAKGRTTPELRKPGAEPESGEFQKFLDVLKNRKQGQ
jgi:hypothetical protein